MRIRSSVAVCRAGTCTAPLLQAAAECAEPPPPPPSSWAAQYTDSAEGVTLYLTQPVEIPASSDVHDNTATLLAFYQAQCAAGGKRAVACNSHASDRQFAGINAVAMPSSYGCNLRVHISSMTGWDNHYETCCGDNVIFGTSDGGASSSRDAERGDMVQLTCSD